MACGTRQGYKILILSKIKRWQTSKTAGQQLEFKFTHEILRSSYNLIQLKLANKA